MRWKRFIAELVGTFVIVLAPSIYSATSNMPNGNAGLLGAALVSGFAVLAMIYALGPICGAHFNPAVTLGFALVRRFPKSEVLPYLLAQFGGGILAAAVTTILFRGGYGVHIPSSSSVVQCIGVEVILTFMLMFVIIAVATDRRVHGTIPGLSIGLTVVMGVLIGGPITGGSMNPARSLGPALFSEAPAMHALWLYLVAPPIGAILGALCFESIRISREDAVSAQGS